MLAGPDLLVVLHMPHKDIHDHHLHAFPWYQGLVDMPVVLMLFF